MNDAYLDERKPLSVIKDAFKNFTQGHSRLVTLARRVYTLLAYFRPAGGGGGKYKNASIAPPVTSPSSDSFSSFSSFSSGFFLSSGLAVLSLILPPVAAGMISTSRAGAEPRFLHLHMSRKRLIGKDFLNFEIGGRSQFAIQSDSGLHTHG
jgi:hypothetical protein